MAFNFKTQRNLELLKENQPELLDTIEKRLGDLTLEQKAIVAGMCIESAIVGESLLQGELTVEEDGEFTAW